MLFDVLLFLICLGVAIILVAMVSDLSDSISAILLSYLTAFLLMLYPYYRMSNLMDWRRIPFMNSGLALVLSILSIIPLYYLLLVIKAANDDHRHF